MAFQWTKRWAAADDGTVVGGIDLKNLQDDIDSGLGQITSVNSLSYTTTFMNGDLSSGVLSVAHNLTVSGIGVHIYDEDSKLVQPDEVTLVDTDNCTVDLSSYGTLSGTWTVKVFG